MSSPNKPALFSPLAGEVGRGVTPFLSEWARRAPLRENKGLARRGRTAA